MSLLWVNHTKIQQQVHMAERLQVAKLGCSVVIVMGSSYVVVFFFLFFQQQ
jgi:hypothetical protein